MMNSTENHNLITYESNYLKQLVPLVNFNAIYITRHLLIFIMLFSFSVLLRNLGVGVRQKNSTETDTIQTFQNIISILNIINKSSCRDRITTNTLFYKHRLLKIADIHKYELGKCMYLYHQNSLPEVLLLITEANS